MKMSGTENSPRAFVINLKPPKTTQLDLHVVEVTSRADYDNKENYLAQHKNNLRLLIITQINSHSLEQNFPRYQLSRS